MKKVFEFSDYSGMDYDGWWDESYNCEGATAHSLSDILDQSISVEDKKTLNNQPRHKYVIADDEWDYVFRSLNISTFKSAARILNHLVII